MTFFQKKEDTYNFINEDIKKTSMLQWGAAVSVLIVVIFIMVVNYCVISRNNAHHEIRDNLLMESEIFAMDISRNLEMSFSAANAISALMSEGNRYTAKDLIHYAGALQKAQNNTYMVLIADNKGIGYSDDGIKVDISKMNYFLVSRNVRYFITDDDGITHERAYIMTVPYYKGDISVGNIYMFMSAKEIAEAIPTGSYDLAGTFAISDSKGHLLGSAGTKTAFLENRQFIENLENAKFVQEDMTAERIVNRLRNMNRFSFSAEYKGEEKYFVCVPLGVSDWMYITVLNQEYVDRLIATDWKDARSMTIELAVATVIFICLVVVIATLNRVHYNERNKELATKADTDLLTGLNNKMATERKIQEYLEKNPNEQCLFFLFDIDNFKKINDTLGHAFGDEVLRSLGQQLSNEFRVTDIIGRTGGDEFILFLKNMGSDEILEKEAARFANFFHSFQAGEYVKYSATSSIGAAVFPRDAKDYHGLYTSADRALYEAKRRGKNQMVFYNKELEKITPEQTKSTPIESDMR